MNNNKFNYSKDDDAIWNSLFDVADQYEDIAESDLFYEESYYEESYHEDGYHEEGYHKEVTCVSKNYKSSEEALKTVFGYDSFRSGQKPIIDSILAGRDVMAVMPTGAGKSICYQIPALMLPGVTLVISPLISLMQDQVKALNEAGVAAAFVNSSLSESKINDTIKKARQGLYKIIYVAPERLVTDRFLELASNIDISMVTVDESHCISQWGQDFRPSYMKITEFVSTLGKRPIISAFTATATETVREDVICTLGLNNPYVMVTGFDRENLFFQVEKPKNKEQYVLNYLAHHVGESGVIYCATRKNVDNLYEILKKRGFSVGKYHAGMDSAERKQMQDDFVFDYTSIIVATNAFGMGIDKSNVRFVIHYNMPQSMENYYQEAGRAGRDGLDSKCILLFSAQDIVINRFLLEHKDFSDLDDADIETVKERDMQRLMTMERYCYTTECLRNYILKYFGENPVAPCDDCGNCLREFETLDMTDSARQVINCVYELKGRYGKTIIIDILVGAKTARLEEIGAQEFKSYGKLSGRNKNLLRRLIEQMVLEGYLTVGDYQVIGLGDYSALKNPQAKVMVKITDEDKLTKETAKSKTKSKGMEQLTVAGYRLLDNLKKLRLEIAREEHMPPYIIFNDRTLIDMAVKVPASKTEMLNVMGVGENKYAKYGEKFIRVIDECVEKYPELLQNKPLVNRVEEPVKKRRRAGKQEFFLLQWEADKYKYVDLLHISDIRDEMNRICSRDNVKMMTASKLMDVLMSKGLIMENNNEGVFGKIPTVKGSQYGIKVIDKVSEKGNAYTVLMYPPIIQHMLVECFVDKEIE